MRGGVHASIKRPRSIRTVLARALIRKATSTDGHNKAGPPARTRTSSSILDRVDNAEQAAAECGATPVTKASGKTSGVYFRWAANTRARKAITAFTHNSRRQSRWAQRLYRDARARGKRNPHATRIVARSWIRVIWTCWHTNTPYNPLKHTAEQRAAAT